MYFVSEGNQNLHQILSRWQLLMLIHSTMKWLFEGEKLRIILLQSYFQQAMSENSAQRKVFSFFVSHLFYL